MKKFACGIAVALSLLFPSVSARASGLGVGLQAGVNFNNVSSPSNVPTSSVAGLMAGLNVELRITDDIAIQPELMYVQRSIKYSDPSGISATAHYDSLELPVLAKIKFLDGVRPYIFGGPVAIVNISRGIDASSGTTTLSFSPRSTDFAVDLGAGVEFGPFFANMRYSIGVSELNENSASWSSRGLQLLAGIEF